MEFNRTYSSKNGDRGSPFPFGVESARRRVHLWHTLFNRSERVESENAPRASAPVHGFELHRFAAARAQLPSLSFSCPRISPRNDCLKVVLQVKGECNMRSGRSEATIAASDWTYHDFTSDVEITLTPDAEQLHFLFPADMFRRKPAIDEAKVLSFGGAAGVSRLAGGFLRLLSVEWPFLNDGERTDMIYTAAQLVQLAMNERQAVRRMSMQETLRERVKAYIARNLRDHHLNIERIAEALGCTKRNLHKVFRDDAHTLNAYIWDLRLQRCAADFIDPAKRQQTITQVAFSWGFNNAAHFSRLFRERYGVSASQFRAGMGCVGAAGPRNISTHRRRQAARPVGDRQRLAAH